MSVRELAIATLLCTLTLPAVAASGRPADQPLTATAWVLTELAADVHSGPQISLDFSTEGTVAGTDGCNRYHGRYRRDGSTLELSRDLAATKMLCPESVMNRARAYVSALGETASFAIDGDSLALLDATGEVLARFVASSAELAGTTWRVLAYNNGHGGVVSVAADTVARVEFEHKGRITGTGGCNAFTGDFATRGSSLAITQLAGTRHACSEPDGVMEQEARLMTALGSVASYRIEGERLELRTADGALAVNLVRAIR